MKALVLLSGCGVFDGSEIHESVSTLICLRKNSIDYECTSLNMDMHHVLNHTNGKEINEKRNVLIESSRISRGKITDLSTIKYEKFDCLVIPGGFGVAKNLSSWAFKETDCTVQPYVKKLILNFFVLKKPILSLCVSPTIVAKSLINKAKDLKLTIGSTQHASEYSISEFQTALRQMDVNTINCSIKEVCVDKKNRVVSAPCYMMEANIDEVFENISLAIIELKKLLQKNPLI